MMACRMTPHNLLAFRRIGAAVEAIDPVHKVLGHDSGRVRLEVDSLRKMDESHCSAEICDLVFDFPGIGRLPIELQSDD